MRQYLYRPSYAIIISTEHQPPNRYLTKRKREMGEKISLKVDERTAHGKKVKKLRLAGITPGVVYGQGMDPLAIQADSGEVRRVVAAAGKHTPISLTGAKRQIAMIKDIEYDITKSGVVRHVSFHAVKANEPVVTQVAIRLTGVGESVAERAGLIILQALDEVEVRALPMDLPEAIYIDITKLSKHGDRVTLGDAVIPEGVEIVERDSGRHEEGDEDEEKQLVTDLVVANVYEPAALEAANEAAAGDAEIETEVPAEAGGDDEEVVAEDDKPQDEPK